jgi:DNA primase
MQGLIPDLVIDDILSRIDIVELISGYIPLKRAGRNFKAPCPFHHEKTPSFVVSSDKQIFTCFGCGESGNAFKFLMRYERIEFPEAVRILAQKAGIILPDNERLNARSVGLSTQLYKINELAAAFYQNLLGSGGIAQAKEYIASRAINDATLKLFKVGLALDKWEALIEHLRAKGISLTLLEKAGLVLLRDKGGYYDRFRKRIIFPIFDVKSRVLGFGARIYAEEDKQGAKYLNSPETEIYTKGKNLYGLNFAKNAILENDAVIIVEGYLDCLIPYQEGIHNIVASLGTALTLDQAALLKRHTRNVVMIYDADNAGQMATLRSLDIFIDEEMSVKIVSLPAGLDPDSFVRQKGSAALKERISQAESLFDYKLRILKNRHDPSTPEGKAMIALEMLPTIRRFKNAILTAEYVKKLAEALKVSEADLLLELKKVKTGANYQKPAAVSNKEPLNFNPTEKLLVKLMLEESSMIQEIRAHLSPGDFQDARISKIVAMMFDLSLQGRNLEANKFISHMDETDSRLVCESLLNTELPSENRENIVQDCIKLIKHKKLIFRKVCLQEEIRAAENAKDETRLEKLRIEFCNLFKEGR